MGNESEAPLDRLWDEYSVVFGHFDDLTLARWLAQTVGQLNGRLWRLSHPLLGAYRLASQSGHDRQIWLKRLVTIPAPYIESECCRAPLLPLFTRDVVETGLVCQHCSATAVPFDELPASMREELREWSEAYAPVHAVAHWDDAQRKRVRRYQNAYEDAAVQAEALLARAANRILPSLLDLYPAVVWEDQDECLEVRPEDILLTDPA